MFKHDISSAMTTVDVAGTRMCVLELLVPKQGSSLSSLTVIARGKSDVMGCRPGTDTMAVMHVAVQTRVA